MKCKIGFYVKHNDLLHNKLPIGRQNAEVESVNEENLHYRREESTGYQLGRLDVYESMGAGETTNMQERWAGLN